jgi:hypothetical protein
MSRTSLKEHLDNVNLSKNKIWWLQALLPAYFSYILIRHLIDPEYFNRIFYGINLGFHEAGHYVVFRFFGDFLMTLGGSLFECLAPILIGVSFYRRGDLLAASFCLGWLGTALFDTAIYIADASEMQMQLLFGQHDWNNILSRLGILQYDDLLALAVRFLAVISMSVCIIWGYEIAWRTYNKKQKT